MQPYPLWKFVVLIVVTLVGALYALPNIYGEDPAVQIQTQSGDPVPADFSSTVDKALADEKLAPESSRFENQHWIVRFSSEENQLKAAEALKKSLGHGYVVALNLAPKTPG